jgi:3-hydroxyisobutyrate dehydrogenase
MANQIAIAAGMLGVCESLAYSKQAGLDPNTVLESISSGAAGSWSLTNLAPRMLAGNFAPGFYVKHFIKDMQIAFESAKELGLSTPGLELALSRYQELAANGFGEDGTQALFKLYL